MRRNQISGSHMQKNEEYRKLRDSAPDQRTPREPPGRQAPDKSGYRRPDYDAWTIEELQELAATLEIPEAQSLGREQLIERLLGRELR